VAHRCNSSEKVARRVPGTRKGNSRSTVNSSTSRNTTGDASKIRINVFQCIRSSR
jgi:hypothetical protein